MTDNENKAVNEENDEIKLDNENNAKTPGQEQKTEKVKADTAEKPDECEDGELNRKTRKKYQKQIDELTSKLEDEKKACEKAKAELNDYSDKFIRLLAEFDNYKKRTAKEAEGIYSSAYSDAVQELLPVFDNIERAADYATDETAKCGLVMIINGFRSVLEKMGVTQFGQAGDEFDASLHSAVMHIEDESLGENTVAEVFVKGYKKGDKIIRYATVKVAN